MPRISRLDRSQVSPEVGEIYDNFMKVRGNVPNMFRTVAHRPELLRTMVAHFQVVMSNGALPAKLKELLFVRVSQMNRCEYWLASHTVLARRYGWTDEQLKDLSDFENRSDFTPKEKLALRVAEVVTRDAHSLNDELFSELLREYGEDGAVELLSAIGLFNYFNMFNDALQMEPTK